jgi:hypothetical protein
MTRSKYPPAEPGALAWEPLKAADPGGLVAISLAASTTRMRSWTPDPERMEALTRASDSLRPANPKYVALLQQLRK